MLNFPPKKTFVIVPCFNEEHRLNIKYWNNIVSQFEFTWIFVNDGSTDQTEETLAKIKNITILNLEQNVGKGEALRFGTNYVLSINPDNDFILSFIDSDGAFNESDIARMFLLFDEKNMSDAFESIWASRVALAGRKIERSIIRHYLSRTIISIIGFTDKNLPYDPQTGFKIFLIDKSARVIFSQKFRTRWFFELEIRNRWERLKNTKLKIWEEPVRYWQEIGNSKINRKETFRILIELIIILRMNLKNR